jgi:CRISPR/Cas system CSM-associated protein Csm2 small subunit
MNNSNNLQKVYESIYRPDMLDTADSIKNGSYKSIIAQIRDSIKQQMGDDVVEKLRDKEHFINVKDVLLNRIQRSDLDDNTKMQINKLINKSSNICSLYSAFEINDRLY